MMLYITKLTICIALLTIITTYCTARSISNDQGYNNNDDEQNSFLREILDSLNDEAPLYRRQGIFKRISIPGKWKKVSAGSIIKYSRYNCQVVNVAVSNCDAMNRSVKGAHGDDPVIGEYLTFGPNCCVIV
ncbi:unnamed protein product [Adineta ricciae]|uniref:Uncharacterized protein n=1 Tax=Adineta ricciae TaxID=249248 RepID=A0A815UVA6_ADIRI|nr:unnamed protein product [Adineta ricciae]CAF1559196.1 unnamed protein product [Adineta ricciae]